ncbi:MAG TPA: GDSL-type esterase/lipase family protein [Flavobacterium lutivivi]|nr:GDSL-type esterase/lipase family protein [Flavobacterium lutivivi]
MKALKTTIFLGLTLLTNFLFGQNDSSKDWANLKKYESENMVLNNKPNNVVLMGDSITEFWKVTDNSFFQENNLIDRGISGQTTSQMLLRFRQDVINLKPKTVVILAGINDIAENTGPISIEAIFGNIKSMIELAQANKIKVVLCSVLPAASFYWNPSIKPAYKVVQLNKLLSLYAKENAITYVNYYSEMVDDKLGLQKKYGEDGVHPNIEGYKLMEKLLLEKL